MVVQVLLQVEVGQHLTILHAQKALQLGIRGDVVLVLEVVLLHVGGDGLGHVGPRLLGPVGAAQERAQVIGQASGHLKDRELAGLHLLTLHRLLGLAATFVGLLLELGHALLQTLELRDQGTHGLAHGVGLGQHGLHIILHGDHSGLSGLHRGSHHGGRGGHGGSGHRGGLSLLGRLLGGGGGGGGGHGGRGSHHGGDLLLLGHLLGLLGGGGGRAHYTRCRGRIHGEYTHYSGHKRFNFGSKCLVPPAGGIFFTFCRNSRSQSDAAFYSYLKSFILPQKVSFRPRQQRSPPVWQRRLRTYRNVQI